MPNYTPLTDDERPAIWAEEMDSGRYAYKIILGEDPEDPIKTIRLTQEEVNTLVELDQERN